MQELKRGLHLFHAVHAVFNADPAIVADIAQNLEDGIVVVQPAAGHPVLQRIGIADCAIAGAQVCQGGAGG